MQSRLIRLWTAVILAGIGLCGLFGSFAVETRAAVPAVLQAPTSRVYLPFVLGPAAVSPAGSYSCTEHEYGLIYAEYSIDLLSDGTSLYHDPDPFTTVMTGTWVYTPMVQTIGFTNSFWLTATYESPHRLYSEFRLEEGGSPTRDLWCWRP